MSRPACTAGRQRTVAREASKATQAGAAGPREELHRGRDGGCALPSALVRSVAPKTESPTSAKAERSNEVTSAGRSSAMPRCSQISSFAAPPRMMLLSLEASKVAAPRMRGASPEAPAMLCHAPDSGEPRIASTPTCTTNSPRSTSCTVTCPALREGNAETERQPFTENAHRSATSDVPSKPPSTYASVPKPTRL